MATTMTDLKNLHYNGKKLFEVGDHYIYPIVKNINKIDDPKLKCEILVLYHQIKKEMQVWNT